MTRKSCRFYKLRREFARFCKALAFLKIAICAGSSTRTAAAPECGCERGNRRTAKELA
jgi:hypothetical protein